jgi:hypothetical protein
MAVLALLAAASLAAEDLPPAPGGFRWQKIDSIKAAFLVPTGWHFLEEKKGEVRGVFISREDIGIVGEFVTGLTINVEKLKTGSAPDRAAMVIAQLSALGKVQQAWQSEEGALKLYGARIHVTADPPPFTEQVLAIGNSRTNTLYTIIFESPDLLWDDAWKKGEVMLRDFLLDDEI